MRTAHLLVVVLFAFAALAPATTTSIVPDAIPGGTVTDPQGDAGGGPDIASFSVCYTATELQLTVNLFTPWGSNSAVVIDLDVDQNPNTGVQGFEFVVSAIGQSPLAAVFDLLTNEGIATGPATYGPSSVMISIPLSAIGSDGMLDALAQVGAKSGSVITISDRAPDADTLTSVVCAGPPSTTTTLLTTTTTLPVQSCASDSECDDGNPCTQDRCAAGQCVFPPLAGGWERSVRSLKRWRPCVPLSYRALSLKSSPWRGTRYAGP